MTGFQSDTMRGAIAPILTPFDDDLSIAHELLVDHALRLLDEGCVGLTPFGTTGEAASVAAAERVNALWHLTQGGVAAKRLLPGTGMLDVEGTVSLSRSCLDMGCAAVMILPPHYYKDVPVDGLHAWFARVIEGIGDDARIVLYNIPQVAGIGLPVDLVRRLCRDFPDRVVGIKDSSGDLDYAKAILRIEGLRVWLGSEILMAQTVSRGVTGTITATANLNAAKVCAFVKGALDGDAMETAYLRESVGAAREAMSASGYISTPKRVLAVRTGDDRWANVRPPMLPSSRAAADALEAALGRIG